MCLKLKVIRIASARQLNRETALCSADVRHCWGTQVITGSGTYVTLQAGTCHNGPEVL